MTNEDIKKALTEMGANEQEINTLTDAVEKKRVK